MGSSREPVRRAEGAKNLRSLNHYPARSTTLYVATYNCRSLANQARLIELENEAVNIKWDVIGISEVRRKDEELIELESGNILYHKGTENGRTSGVGFLINKKWKDRIVDISSTSDRVASLSLRLSRRYTIQIVQFDALLVKIQEILTLEPHVDDWDISSTVTSDTTSF
ncbi:uncharacterized protein [Diabrotica undecimpunctata]|uniref:uncharacterized protein n=2 Tax=Diabrotica undecimpunctata TaxID=50387 RepID=UPI003B635713